MKDIELSKILNISTATLSDWKKADTDNWRRLVYEIMVHSDIEKLKKKVEAVQILNVE